MAPRGRTAILDIDYHHGNGTQDVFWERSDVAYLSVHALPDEDYPFYTGYEDETGAGPGLGFTRNYPVPVHSAPSVWISAFENALAEVQSLKPEYLVVSIGTDTAANDPIGTFALSEREFSHIGRSIAALGAPTLYVMEGGYEVPLETPHVLHVLRAHDLVLRDH